MHARAVDRPHEAVDDRPAVVVLHPTLSLPRAHCIREPLGVLLLHLLAVLPPVRLVRHRHLLECHVAAEAVAHRAAGSADLAEIVASRLGRVPTEAGLQPLACLLQLAGVHRHARRLVLVPILRTAPHRGHLPKSAGAATGRRLRASLHAFPQHER